MPRKSIKLYVIKIDSFLLVDHFLPPLAADLSHPCFVKDLLGSQMGGGHKGSIAASLATNL